MARAGSRPNFFSFPDPVNEVAARVVAGGVVAMSVVAVALDERWVALVLCYGFWARVLTGPRLSPLGQFANRVAAPAIGHAKAVPGPPKRFAQAIGTVFSSTAVLLWFALPDATAARVVLGLLAVAAGLESFAGYCLGCRIFALLMRVGLVPPDYCPECADLSLRHPQLRAGAGSAGR